jgi:twitching motility two-component system response regulator PilH
MPVGGEVPSRILLEARFPKSSPRGDKGAKIMSVNKVLVCDDSATDLVKIKNIIEAEGRLTITASNGVEAVARARTEHPDMIFLDILMPEMDGFETCRRLRDDPATRDIPVIFVSSKNQKADRVWAQMQGAKELISKPYRAEQIVARLG